MAHTAPTPIRRSPTNMRFVCCWVPVVGLLVTVGLLSWALRPRVLSVQSPSRRFTARADFYLGQFYSDRIRVTDVQTGVRCTAYDRLEFDPVNFITHEAMVVRRDIIWDPTEVGFLYIYYTEPVYEPTRLLSRSPALGPDAERYVRAFEVVPDRLAAKELPPRQTPWARALARRHPPPLGVRDSW